MSEYLVKIESKGRFETYHETNDRDEAIRVCEFLKKGNRESYVFDNVENEKIEK